MPISPKLSGVLAQLAGKLLGPVIHLFRGPAFTLLRTWVGNLKRVPFVGGFSGLGWRLTANSLMIPFLAGRCRPFVEPDRYPTMNLLSELIYGLVLGSVSSRLLSGTPRVQA